MESGVGVGLCHCETSWFTVSSVYHRCVIVPQIHYSHVCFGREQVLNLIQMNKYDDEGVFSPQISIQPFLLLK